MMLPSALPCVRFALACSFRYPGPVFTGLVVELRAHVLERLQNVAVGGAFASAASNC